MSLWTFICFSLPVERPPDQLEELLVGFVEEVVEFAQDFRRDAWMLATFRAVQASLAPAVAQTEEALGLVEVEVGGVYLRLQMKELLHLLHLRKRVSNQRVSVYEMNVAPGKHVEPASHVEVIQTAVQGLVVEVELPVVHQQRLEHLLLLVFLQTVVEDLCVIRQQSLGRLADDQQQPRVGIHPSDALRNTSGGEVRRGFLHRQLTRPGERHLGHVPIHAAQVVTVPVEEVHLAPSRDDVTVEIEHLDESTRAALPHADDDDVGQAARGGGVSGGQRRGLSEEQQQSDDNRGHLND